MFGLVRTQPGRPADTGAIALIYTFVIILAIGILGLVADIGRAMAERRDAQTAADLAALAGGQDLPDTTSAQATVADYLQRNGWPAVSVAALSDTDLTNGEVEFVGTTKMRVRTPKQETTYFFGPTAAALLGNSSASGVDIGARAAVEIRSGLGVLPFVVKYGVAQGQTQCIKVGAGPQNPDDCDPSDTGNFGYADIGRADSNNKILERNTREGLDHNPSAFDIGDGTSDPNLNLPVLDPALFPKGSNCVENPAPAPSGAIFDKAPWVNPFNCLRTEPGNKASELVDGLVKYSVTPTTCDGRIGTPTGDVANGFVEGCFLTRNNWEDYTDPDDPDAPVDIAVLDDPRFGFLPRVWSDDLQGSSQYAIIGFYGAYISNIYTKNGNNVEECGNCAGNSQIYAFKAELFALTRLTQDIYPNSGPTGSYNGSGPKTVVLVE